MFIAEKPSPPAKAGDLLYAGGVDHDVDLSRKFTFDVAFAEPGAVESKPIIPTLHEMMDHVTGIVTNFWSEGHRT